MELISVGTRRAFREHLSGWHVLRDIDDYFGGEGITPGVLVPGREPGTQRRRLAEEYYSGVDWGEHADVQRVLRAYERILIDFPPDADESERERLLDYLRRDGYEFDGSRLTSGAVAELAALGDASAVIDRQVVEPYLQRIAGALDADPSHAIGAAKELLETVTKSILRRRGEDVPSDCSVQQLTKKAMVSLGYDIDHLPESRRGVGAIRQVFAGMTQVAAGTAELRNLYGTGHGHAEVIRFPARHARLVVGSVSALVRFLLETLEAKEARERVAESTPQDNVPDDAANGDSL